MSAAIRVRHLPFEPEGLIKDKLICDILFGAASEDEYMERLGRRLGVFSLCVVTLCGQDSPVSAAIAALRARPECRRAAVFAAAPDRVVLLVEHRKKSAELASAASATLTPPDFPVCCVETSEGQGIHELRQGYLDCSRRAAECMERHKKGAGHGQPEAPKPSLKPSLSRAMDFIARHFTEQISLNDVADHAFVSPWHISRSFQKELGMSFVDYLGSMRVERAKQLLLKPELKVFEVAELVGISDSHYFSKLFKRHAGLSPSQFRAKNRE